MAEYIKLEVLLNKLSRMIDFCKKRPFVKKDQKVTGLTALFQVGDAIMDCPAADVVPIEALERLRDELYAQDLITMEALKRLNTLIVECRQGRKGG